MQASNCINCLLYSWHLKHHNKLYFLSLLSISMPYNKAGIQLERNAVYTKLQTKIGLVVMWNGDDAVMVKPFKIMLIFDPNISKCNFPLYHFTVFFIFVKKNFKWKRNSRYNRQLRDKYRATFNSTPHFKTFTFCCFSV